MIHFHMRLNLIKSNSLCHFYMWIWVDPMVHRYLQISPNPNESKPEVWLLLPVFGILKRMNNLHQDLGPTKVQRSWFIGMVVFVIFLNKRLEFDLIAFKDIQHFGCLGLHWFFLFFFVGGGRALNFYYINVIS